MSQLGGSAFAPFHLVERLEDFGTAFRPTPNSLATRLETVILRALDALDQGDMAVAEGGIGTNAL